MSVNIYKHLSQAELSVEPRHDCTSFVAIGHACKIDVIHNISVIPNCDITAITVFYNTLA